MSKFKSIYIAFGFLAVLGLRSCAEKNYETTAYLRKVLHNLEQIETAVYYETVESWSHGAQKPNFTAKRYMKSYRNSADTTIGASFVALKSDPHGTLNFAYDGVARALVYEDSESVVLDSFKVRDLDFRPISPPFYNYVESIIGYILNNSDSTQLELKDLGAELYVKLTIHEDYQVEFFGKPYYMPQNRYIPETTSIYELWIDKSKSLPHKIRREMFHDISVDYIDQSEFNTLNIADFSMSDYFPKGYQIWDYGESPKYEEQHPLLGEKAPAWALPNAQGESVSMESLSSRVLLVQFTSVSCGPCRVSIPFLTMLDTKYSSADLDIVAIECTANSTDVLKNYMNRNNFNYKFLLSNRETMGSYGIRSFPVFFVLDQDRVVQHIVNGYSEGDTDREIMDAIDVLLLK